MKVKICGITNIEDALFSVRYGADALGFIFYEKSKRYLPAGEAQSIIKQLPPFVVKVGVFVDEDYNSVNETAKLLNLQYVQLHGNEDNTYITRINYPVIKAVRIYENYNYKLLDDFSGCTLLLDSFNENLIGGTGDKFDWNKIPGELKDKIILAGGINEDNLDEIFELIKPAAIDVSSGVEEYPGKKDHNKLYSFLKKINKLRGY